MALILDGTSGLSDVDGSAATPAIRGTDTNTGMFFPAADTIAFAEGGAEIARFDSSGNLGIGTTTFNDRLNINGGIAFNKAITSGNPVEIKASFNGGNSAAQSAIQFLNPVNGFGGAMSFYTQPEVDGTSMFERMRITSAGNVGIGTSSPSVPLTVAGEIRSTTTAGFVINNGSELGSLKYSGGLIINRVAGTTLFFTAGGDNQAVIDSSGNVGIGTSSPAQKLDVTGNAAVSGQLMAGTTTAYSDGSIGTPRLQWRAAAGAYAGAVSITDTTNNIDHWVLRNPNGNIASIGTNGTSFIFNTASAERMRIDSSGNVLFGTTDTNTGNGAVMFRSSGVGTYWRNATSTGGSWDHWNFYIGTTLVGRINTSGSNTSYITSSDYRLKENIAPMTGALTVVGQLKPCTYTWKVDGSDGQGFIAHELAEVVPDAVVGEKDAVDEEGNIKPQGIDTSFLVATLTAAIQEQQAIINDLTTRLTALENK